jgi:hypothetical protein
MSPLKSISTPKTVIPKPPPSHLSSNQPTLQIYFGKYAVQIANTHLKFSGKKLSRKWRQMLFFQRQLKLSKGTLRQTEYFL